jgi:hypothetical protein
VSVTVASSQVGEHPTLAQKVDVSLTNLFKGFTITAAQEVTLGANQVRAVPFGSGLGRNRSRGVGE